MAEKDIFDPTNLLEQRGDLVDKVADFAIKPNDVDISRHFGDAFGNNETEVSAAWIVRMCQQRNSWEPFTQDEIEAFYQAGGQKGSFNFYQLVEPQQVLGIRNVQGSDGPVYAGGGWVVKKGDGKFHLTTAFVEAVQKSSPATKQ